MASVPVSGVGRTSVLARSGVSMDRVRWGPVIAGLFVSLAVLAVLATLGVAVGFSAADRNDSASTFGIGAGIWGAASALIAFFVGGLVAARTAATPVTAVDTEGHLKNDNGLLQGAMVWAVAIPLTTYLAASTVSGAIGGAGRAVAGGLQTGIQATATAAQGSLQNNDSVNRVADAQNGRDAVERTKQEAVATTQQVGEAAKSAGEQLKGVKDQVTNEVNRTFTPENLEKAAGYGATASWGVLGSMLLGLAASSVGGLIGGKTRSATVTLEAAR